MTSFNSQTSQCLVEEVAAYVDGELDDHARDSFELHIAGCGECAGELLKQRQLLCTLDAAFQQEHEVDLPRNFAQVVAAHAETDMRGMRDGAERRQALRVSAVLALASFALLGAASGESVWGPARNIARYVQIFINFFWDAIYQAGAGLAIILRILTRSFVFESRLLGFLILLLFGTALALLPHLIARYHRAEIVE
jgi:putative zinc finger protein